MIGCASGFNHSSDKFPIIYWMVTPRIPKQRKNYLNNTSMSKTVEKGRDARTGRFIPIKEAERRPATTVVEKVKVGPTKHRNK